MTKVFDLQRLNVPLLAQQNAHLQGTLSLGELDRLALGLAAVPSLEPTAIDTARGSPSDGSVVHWSMAFFESELPALNTTTPMVVSSPRVAPLGQLLSREHPTLVLGAKARVSLVCQRCLAPFEEALEVQRRFYWVANEDTALALDEALEDDLLVSSTAFDGQALVEDELILALPLVPMHESCPVALSPQLGSSAQDDLLSSRPNPFAVLSGLKVKKG